MDQQASKNVELARRDFLKASVAVGAGAFLASASASHAADAAPAAEVTVTGGAKKRYAIVGTGSRSKMYQGAITTKYKDTAELVGLCDTNQGRLNLAQNEIAKTGAAKPPTFLAADFDKMIAETKPETVIVTTIDGFHNEYICRAMKLGCNVITEKPMTTTAEKCQQIIDTQKETGRQCKVTFNYRYSPPRSQVKDILMSGAIGDVLSVDFHWLLNTQHGADYFRRWHSYKKNSGGLMIHKATHHFDLVNWWLSAVPVSVFATGKREFYTPEMAKRFGLTGPHERCHTCPEQKKCGFFMDISRGSLKDLYLDCEQFDGYFRDRCVFRPDIEIEDTMNVLVKYNTGTTMSYSVNTFNAWEGYLVAFNGTKGRLEHKMEEGIYVNGTNTVQGGSKEGGTTVRVMPLRTGIQEIEPWTGKGGHGGGDAVMLDDIFSPERKADKYLRAADQRSGAYSCLVGVAANKCFLTNQPVNIDDLVKNIGMPDYPVMPNHTDSLPMPGKGVIS